MLRVTVVSIVAISVLLSGVAATREPAGSDSQEAEQARRVLIETLALDLERRTVADLTQDEFQLTIGGKPAPVVSFELLCPVGAVADPKMHKKGDPAPAPIAPATPRKIVLAVDYNSLNLTDRRVVLDAVESMLRMSKTPAEEIMLVALADGVRVEQRFTTNTSDLVASLQRMKHDVTLWARDSGAAAEGQGYFDDLATLMDLLAAHDGAKAVVLFSTLLSRRDQNDLWFQNVATRAAAARTAIYSDWARGLQFGTTKQAARTLQRLASETGGRPPIATSDLSLQYRRAQRDLACRYVLGVQLGDEEAQATQAVRVRVARAGVILRYPEQVRLWTDEQRRESRMRALFVDPEPSENALARVFAFPLRPVNREWHTLLALQVPLRGGAGDAPMELTATLERGGRSVEQYRASIPTAAGARSGARSVTVTADSSLKPGDYDLAFALSREGDDDLPSGRVRFELPAVPKKGLFVQGPILARAIPGGVLIRGDADDVPNDTALDEVFGDESGYEPLLVQEVDAADRFLAYWEACLAGNKGLPPAGSVVRRRFMTPDGIEAHLLSPVPFELEPKGEMRCVHALDEIAPRTLRRGEYKLEVSIEKPGGESLAGGSVRLRVD